MSIEEQTSLGVSAVHAFQGGDTPFFSSPELAQRLDLLRHLTESSDLIPLVKGRDGAGKSALIEQIIASATDNWLICRIEATPMLQPEQLFIQLAGTFGTTGGSDALEQFGQRFTDLRREGTLPVIIVDDADLLPEMSIITLLQLYTRLPEDRPMVRILLFAQPEIDAVLESPQVQSMGLSVIQVLEMPLLKREQTAAFIDHILAATDSGNSVRMSAAQSDKIFLESGGLPGKVEQLVRESMRSGIVQWGAARLSSVSPLTTILGIVGVVLVLLILIFQDGINALFGEPESSEQQVEVLTDGTVPLTLPPAPVEETPEPLAPPPEVKAVHEQPVVLPESPEATPQQRKLAEPVAVEAGEPELSSAPEEIDRSALEVMPTEPAADAAVEEGVDSTEPPATKELTTGSVVVEKPESPPATEPALPEGQADVDTGPQAEVQFPAELDELQPEPIAIEEPGQQLEPLVTAEAAQPSQEEATPEQVAAPVEEVAQIEPAAVKESVAPVEPAKVEDSVTPEPKESSSAPTKPKPAPVRDATPKKTTTKRPAQTTGGGVKQEAWLLQQRPGDYTLQLIGLRNAQGIPRFIKQYSLGSNAAYFRTSHQGQPWFVVLYGVYPSRSAAVKAKGSLPPSLRKTDVWPRSFESVQKEIRNR